MLLSVSPFVVTNNFNNYNKKIKNGEMRFCTFFYYTFVVVFFSINLIIVMLSHDFHLKWTFEL